VTTEPAPGRRLLTSADLARMRAAWARPATATRRVCPDCQRVPISGWGTRYCPSCTSVRQARQHELEQQLRDGTAVLPTKVLNAIRGQMRGSALDPHDDVAVKQFCRTRTDEELLGSRNVGVTALALVRAWSGPPEEIIGNWVGEDAGAR
jgi:hypothetical protein